MLTINKPRTFNKTNACSLHPRVTEVEIRFCYRLQNALQRRCFFSTIITIPDGFYLIECMSV